jgi:predicted GNAT family acetyltransferase
MSYRLIEHTDARAFHDAVIGHLLRSEAECCVQIGIIRRMVHDGYSPVSADELSRPLLWTVQNGSHIDLVAVQTLKDKMIVTRASPQAMACLADALASRHWAGSSLIGVTPSIEILVDRYATLTHRRRSLAIRLRVFQLEQVIRPKPAGGEMRLSNRDDRQVLARFIAGFETEIGETSQENALTRADRLIADGRLYVWTDPNPVAMAAWAGPTPNGVRVNWVYTAPDRRGKGYASNLVANLTQRLLGQGRKFCFLFTDLANPTSNSIYQKIGYRPVSDSERWEFGELAAVRPVR